jgi:hypothetical protein
MPKSSEKQLEALKAKKAQLDARISALNARRQKEAKRLDTRRKVVAGAIALEHCEHDANFKELLGSLLNRFLTRPVDRELFVELFGIDPATPGTPEKSTAKDKPDKPKGDKDAT